MRSTLLVLSVTVLALLMVSAVSIPADARSGHHHHSYGGGSFGPRAFSVGPRVYSHQHHRHHGRIFYGAPLVYGGYYYYNDYYSDCSWLRRRAIYTGSRYWWDRYYACVYDGY